MRWFSLENDPQRVPNPLRAQLLFLGHSWDWKGSGLEFYQGYLPQVDINMNREWVPCCESFWPNLTLRDEKTAMGTFLCYYLETETHTSQQRSGPRCFWELAGNAANMGVDWSPGLPLKSVLLWIHLISSLINIIFTFRILLIQRLFLSFNLKTLPLLCWQFLFGLSSAQLEKTQKRKEYFFGTHYSGGIT